MIEGMEIERKLRMERRKSNWIGIVGIIENKEFKKGERKSEWRIDKGGKNVKIGLNGDWRRFGDKKKCVKKGKKVIWKWKLCLKRKEIELGIEMFDKRKKWMDGWIEEWKWKS